MADMIIHPINHSFVAEISGVDLKSLTENDFKKDIRSMVNLWRTED